MTFTWRLIWTAYAAVGTSTSALEVIFFPGETIDGPGSLV